MAWKEFRRDKSNRQDTQKFEFNLEDNIFDLHYSLKSGIYQHGGYESFYVHDPKRRHIHKASVRDRLLHHAIFRVIEPIFDRKFIFDSWSCRKGKGTHRAVLRFQNFGWKLSRNNTKSVWILKCDIKKFFDSVDQQILLDSIQKVIRDDGAIKLIKNIIYSFREKDDKGIPLGNLTSQLFANVYLNELDQFIKRKMRVKYYLRYCDDFVVLSQDKDYLVRLVDVISSFLTENLKLHLHPRKISVKKYHQGVDFLGFVSFPFFRLLRTSTKKRMIRKLSIKFNEDSLASYLGLLKHCRSYELRKEVAKSLIFSYNEAKFRVYLMKPSFESFKGVADVERLKEIQKLKEDLIKSGKLTPEAASALSAIDIDEKSKELAQALETMGRERETISVDEKKKEVRIGRERTPIWESPAEDLSWDLEGEQLREAGKTIVELYFRRADGLEIRPGVAKKTEKARFEEKERFLSLGEYQKIKKEHSQYSTAMADLSSKDEGVREKAEKYVDEFKKKYPESEWVFRALRHLNTFASESSRELLDRDPEFVETPHMVETMEKMTSLINRQLERKQGVLILEGEAGTGKNKIVDHFAYLTRRPVFRFVCSAGKDEQDFKYLLEYDPDTGTERIKSTVVKALQTPGSILVFDEINTLKPEIAKTLNSLFDHDRALYFGEDKGVVKASEEVILIGLENPQHYMGVKPLAETIKSRARIMEAAYPPLEKAKKDPKEPTKYRSDEAMIMRQYLPELKGLSRRDFQMLWDGVVNRERAASPTQMADLLTAERQQKIQELKEIVTIANKIRNSYRRYHEGSLDAKIEFVFSLRESVECAYELRTIEVTEEEKKKGITRAKKAIQEVILPKIPLGEERTFLTSLISEI